MSIKAIIESGMKQCFDKGIEIGLANSGKIGKVTIDVTDIRDEAEKDILAEFEKMLPSDEDIQCLKRREKELMIASYNEQYRAVFKRIYQCLSDIKAKLEER